MIEPNRVPLGWNWCVGITETLMTASAWQHIQPYRDEWGNTVYARVVSATGETVEEAFKNLLQRMEQL